MAFLELLCVPQFLHARAQFPFFRFYSRPAPSPRAVHVLIFMYYDENCDSLKKKIVKPFSPIVTSTTRNVHEKLLYLRVLFKYERECVCVCFCWFVCCFDRRFKCLNAWKIYSRALSGSRANCWWPSGLRREYWTWRMRNLFSKRTIKTKKNKKEKNEYKIRQLNERECSFSTLH
jgi:hypothetical protein